VSDREHSSASTFRTVLKGRRWITAAVVCTVSVTALFAGPPQLRAARRKTGPKPNVLLVHSAFSDGSIWNKVTRSLLDDGYNVVASQIPLTSFGDDVAAVQRDLRVLDGPTLVVGHSSAGAVITQAAQDAPNVTGLVFIAAVAPEAGETGGVFNQLAPPLPSLADFVPIDPGHTGENGAPFLLFARDRLEPDGCQDCGATEARLLAATETPTNASEFSTPITGVPAWKQFPSWYQISSEDRIINPDAERIMARRVDPTGARTIELRSSHLSLVSHAGKVAAFIERAAR
jgi:pimeloyl-ACP methyl ester carboxylesterase